MKTRESRPDLYGPDGYFAKFIEMANAVKAAKAKIEENEARRSAAYQLGYREGRRAILQEQADAK